MTRTMDEYDILSSIDRGGFLFKVENPEDLEDVKGFRSVVQVIRSLERQGLVKVNTYMPSRKFGKHSHDMVDRVLVEHLTRDGKMELKRLKDTGRTF